MRGFSRRVTVDDAWAWVDQNAGKGSTERVGVDDAARRVLAEDVVSEVDVPAFERAMMDGFAVRAADIGGATNFNRLTLQVVGEVLPGHEFEGQVGPRQAARIMTGSPLPDGADAVLPVERTEIEADLVHALADVPPGKHVGRRGEDIRRGTTVLRTGRRLRPQDVGLLASIGVSRVQVVSRVRVRILPTGNELLPPGSRPRGVKIVDSNSPILTELVRRDGGVVLDSRIIPDQPDRLLAAMRGDADVVLVSGGSSVGQEDHAPRLLDEHGELAIHGIAMRPSSPAGMGRLDGRLVFLLPGNPVSCMCAYDFFAGRAIRRRAGLALQWPYHRTHLPLRRKLVSQIGRVDYARVSITDRQEVEPIAISGASVLSSTTKADGFVVIPSDSEGYSAGTCVEVHLYD